MPPITQLDVITDAYLEAGIFEAGETLPAEDAAFGQSKLSRLLDVWNADGLMVYAQDFNQYLLTPNVQPLLIGQAFVITAAQITSGVGLFTAKNQFKVGQYVDTAGNIAPALNVTNALVINATPGSFQVNIASADVASAVQNAKAVYTGNPVPDYATYTQRPATILNANIILNNVNPQVKCPLRIRDDDWWSANSVPQTTTTLPTDLYYSAGWPNGQIFLWPLQTSTYGLELETWVNLADIADLTYPFYLPQGYRDAVTYSLAESLCPSYDVSVTKTAMLVEGAKRARAKVAQLNSVTPRIVTADSGIPKGNRSGSYFNWLNGTVAPGR